MNKQQKKIIRYILLILGGILLALIVILTPIMTEVVWISDDNLIEQNATSIALMTLLPFLSSIICFLVSEKFISPMLQEQKNKVEDMYNNGFLSIDKYIEIMKYLDDYDFEKQKAKMDLETKKEVAKIEQEKKVREEIKKAREEIKKEFVA